MPALCSPPGPGALPALGAVRRCLDDVPPGARILVACSGGADSLALLLAVGELVRPGGAREDLRGAARALHVDHGLRPESGAEGDFVAGVCEQLGLPLLRVGVDARVGRDGRRRPGGPEAGARAARREAYARHLEAGDFLLLGHTADDQAEQVLLALARGAGLRAVAGISPRAELAGAVILRPLLGLRRAQTEAACAAFGTHYVRDPSNRADGPWRAADGSALRRAAVRERALPALAAALGTDPIPALARTAAQARADLEALDLLAARLYREALLPGGGPALASQAGGGAAATSATNAHREGGRGGEAAGGASANQGGEIRLDCAILAGAPRALRTRALHLAGQEAGWEPSAINASHIDALDALVTSYRGQKETHLPANVRAHRSGPALRIWRKNGP
ncbi:tRNA lysidine(34) synthetase TilS [Buchananella felis]|uniref:tRNA lysidine(34) synthetase TilS n=1 Tax=Buchananella felis TaxID=3231492 RepID=UPI003529C6D7